MPYIECSNDQRLNFSDLEFDTRTVGCLSSCGTPYTRTVRVGMPRIPPKHLDCVVYLYATRADAEKGKGRGGTGFFVVISPSVPGKGFAYIVTNWHVAVQRGFSVARVERVDGGHDIFVFDSSEWHFLPEYDIAVIEAPGVSGLTHKISFGDVSHFVTKEHIERARIGPGDDVFMVGRFIDHQGSKQNVPAVRFGNISTNPAPVLQENGNKADTYCIDMHSRHGYSGSPVFVYRTPGYDLEEPLGSGLDRKLLYSGTSLLLLLGIHWGQFPEMWEVTDRGRLKYGSRKESSEPLLTDGRFIMGLSGMTCVLPAWTIAEVLNMPALKVRRDAENARLAEGYGDIPIAEGSVSKEAGDGPEEGDKILGKMLNTPPNPRK